MSSSYQAALEDSLQKLAPKTRAPSIVETHQNEDQTLNIKDWLTNFPICLEGSQKPIVPMSLQKSARRKFTRKRLSIPQ